MRVPILKQNEFLIASLQSDLTDMELINLQTCLADMVGDSSIHVVIIDVSLADVLDSFACRVLRTVGQVLRLRGAETIIVGIAPEVAFSMSQLGLTLEGIETALDLEQGLSIAKELIERGDLKDVSG
jgi:rsbT antagonist protein RsbS